MTVPHTTPREKVLPTADRLLVSERIASELCSVSLPTFRKWMQAGVIDRVDLPGNLRRNLYLREDVVALAGRLASHS